MKHAAFVCARTALTTPRSLQCFPFPRANGPAVTQPPTGCLPLQEITDLRKTLNTEVDSLRSEFLDLKSALKSQLELTSGLSSAQVRGCFMFGSMTFALPKT